MHLNALNALLWALVIPRSFYTIVKCDQRYLWKKRKEEDYKGNLQLWFWLYAESNDVIVSFGLSFPYHLSWRGHSRKL
jgi:hypothetical protein